MKNIRLYFIFAVLLCVPMSTSSMGKVKNLFQSPGFKRNFYKVCRMGNLGLTFGPGVLTAYKTAQKEKEIQSLPDAPKPIYDFAQEQMKAIGLNSPNLNIKVATNQWLLNSCVSATNTMTLGVSDGQRDELSALLHYKEQVLLDQKQAKASWVSIFRNKNSYTERLQDIEKGLDVYRYVIQHESNHVKNNDVQHMLLMRCVTAPVLTHWGFKGLRNVASLCKLIGSKKVNPSALKSLSEIPAGFGKLVVAGNMSAAYARYFEQRADDQVADTKEILSGGMATMKHYKLLLFGPEGIPTDMSPVWQHLLEYSKDPLHPTPSQRIKRLEARTAQLKELNE